MNCDVVIPISERTIKVLPIVIESLRKYLLNTKRIVLMGNVRLHRLADELGCDFVDEDKVYEDMTINRVDQLLKKRYFESNRTGWYFQQFLKMAYAFMCDDEYYIVWDSDLIVLKCINMLNEYNIPYFDVKSEYHKPYFSTINRLFGYHSVLRRNNHSYISEHMIIKCRYMREMIDEICANTNIPGTLFYEKIINAIRAVDIPGSGFSEFETYGNYVDNRYQNQYIYRNLMTLREAELFLGNNPSETELDWASNSFEMINIECRRERIKDLNNEVEEMNNKSLLEVVKEYHHLIEFEEF